MNLKKYIQGDRKGKEAHRIEREALKDPFLQDALEGFDTMKGDHAKRIETLQRQVMVASRPKQHLFAKWSVAATILLLISIGGYLFFTDKGSNRPLIAQQTQSIEIQKQTPSSNKDEIARAKQVGEVVQAPVARQRESQSEKKRITETPQIEQEESALFADEMLVVDVIIQRDTIVIPSIDETNNLTSVNQTRQDSSFAGLLAGQMETAKYGSNNMNGKFEFKIEEPKDFAVGGTNTNEAFEFKAFEFNDFTVQHAGKQIQELAINPISDPMNTTSHERLRKKIIGSTSVVKENKSEPTIGWETYNTYLKEKQNHPVDESGNPIKGEVKLSFHVSEQGNPINITIEKSLGEKADKEAVRLIEEGADWTCSKTQVSITIPF